VQFGNLGKNTFRGPGLDNQNFTLIKRVQLKERTALQFRAEFFDIFNHANFRLPDNDISSPTFGQISEALPGRVVQLALKFLF
jgi:hypothetical protein